MNSTSSSSIKSQFRDFGFARVNYPLIFKRGIENMALNWRNFYVQTPNHKNLINFDEKTVLLVLLKAKFYNS